jgi:hypothetical protein
MAMPSSGAISMKNIWNEHFHDNPNYGSTPTAAMSIWTWEQSANDGAYPYEEWDRTPNLNGSQPCSLSEWYGAAHEFGGGA